VINPYDLCVANKKIVGEHMTICFHVDDCKLSHRKTKAMDNMIEYIRQEYESVGSQTRDRSKGKPGLVEKDIRSSGSDDLQPGKKEVFTISVQPRGKT
jgi:hypothetical protein